MGCRDQRAHAPSPPAHQYGSVCVQRESNGSCVVCGERPRPGFFGRWTQRILRLTLIYMLAVFAGGTLKTTGHPDAIRIGEAMHTVTFTDEIQTWAFYEGYSAIFVTMDFLTDGVDVSGLVEVAAP